jgi:hypothetical protein
MLLQNLNELDKSQPDCSDSLRPDSLDSCSYIGIPCISSSQHCSLITFVAFNPGIPSSSSSYQRILHSLQSQIFIAA